ncbi:MAG: hypothetical protein JO354_12920 [Verrucomicrobia bacterium]|nr:hypothetical protein [Verrucomicrobiota bacterium]
MTLPRVITTSVVRSACHGESHGGVYLVDLDSGAIDQVIDWNDPAISWEGRGGDRGLRGIAFHGDEIYIAASDEVFVYDRTFTLLTSYRNKYLKHCHEIFIKGDTLYLTSTKTNSILEFDLAEQRFACGYLIVEKRRILARLPGFGAARKRFHMITFDPNTANAAPPSEMISPELHINNVTRQNSAVFVSATQVNGLLALEAGEIREYARLPFGTHNAAPYRSGVIYNDTKADRIVIADKDGRISQTFAVPRFDNLPQTALPNDHARQSFARGLCTFGDDVVIGGSSPSTISAYDRRSGELIRSISISKDIRNCIHGLEIWPY